MYVWINCLLGARFIPYRLGSNNAEKPEKYGILRFSQRHLTLRRRLRLKWVADAAREGPGLTAGSGNGQTSKIIGKPCK